MLFFVRQRQVVCVSVRPFGKVCAVTKIFLASESVVLYSACYDGATVVLLPQRVQDGCGRGQDTPPCLVLSPHMAHKARQIFTQPLAPPPPPPLCFVFLSLFFVFTACSSATPLHWAAAKGHVFVVRLLMMQESDVNSRDSS